MILQVLEQNTLSATRKHLRTVMLTACFVQVYLVQKREAERQKAYELDLAFGAQPAV